MRNDGEDFMGKLAFQGWSEEDYEYRNDLLKIIKTKLEDWFEVEVHDAYDVGHGWNAVSCLFNDLRQSEVAKSIGLFVFSETFGYLRGVWEESQNICTNHSDWEGTCRTELDRLETSVLYSVIPWFTTSSLNNILKALNKWELETKINSKLKSLREDF